MDNILILAPIAKLEFGLEHMLSRNVNYSPCGGRWEGSASSDFRVEYLPGGKGDKASEVVTLNLFEDDSTVRQPFTFNQV